MLDDSCNLECAGIRAKKKKAKPIEFVGPVKIVIIESTTREYWLKIFESGMITLAFFLMGMGVATVLHYVLIYRVHWTMNIHVAFNTLACQFCLTSAFLLNNDLFISAIPMEKGDRAMDCQYLSIVAHVMFVVSNVCTISVYRSYFRYPNVHAVFGLINFIITLAYTPTLFITLWDEDYLEEYSYYINILGMVSYLFCSVSYCTGLFQDTMYEFLYKIHPHFVYFGVMFCVFYTMVAVKKPLIQAIDEFPFF